MHELGEIQGLNRRAQIARICLDLFVLGRQGADLLERGSESSLSGGIIFGEILLRQRMPTAMRPGMMQDNAISVPSKPMGLRRELNQSLAVMAKGRRGWNRLWLVVVVVRAIVHIIVKLGPHLFLQVVFRLVNLLLQAVTGVVVNKALLRALGWDVGRDLFIHLAKLL